ncbi:hypothetical protein D9M71_221930 [compost metagenome]
MVVVVLVRGQGQVKLRLNLADFDCVSLAAQLVSRCRLVQLFLVALELLAGGSILCRPLGRLPPQAEGRQLCGALVVLAVGRRTDRRLNLGRALLQLDSLVVQSYFFGHGNVLVELGLDAGLAGQKALLISRQYRTCLEVGDLLGDLGALAFGLRQLLVTLQLGRERAFLCAKSQQHLRAGVIAYRGGFRVFVLFVDVGDLLVDRRLAQSSVVRIDGPDLLQVGHVLLDLFSALLLIRQRRLVQGVDALHGGYSRRFGLLPVSDVLGTLLFCIDLQFDVVKLVAQPLFFLLNRSATGNNAVASSLLL